MTKNEVAMQDDLISALDMWKEFCEKPVKVQTFAEAGLLTRNAGLCVSVGGKSFQLTIVESK